MASKRMQLLIPEGMDARLRRVAGRERVSRGAWVRRAIEERLERGSNGPCKEAPS